MDGVYETTNTATVDLSKVKKVTNFGGGNACGGFVEFNAPQGTIAVSKPNTKALKAWATAPKKGNLPGIDTSKTKVYLRKNASDIPQWTPEAAATLGPALAALWKPPEGMTPLKSSLANEAGQGLSLLFSNGDIKLRVEKAAAKNIDINGTSDKNGAKEFYKFISFQRPVSYYRNKTPVSWTPDISATVSPSYWGSWNDESGKIQFEIDGENFCKSSLMLINPYADFGYWYNSVVGAGDVPEVDLDDLQAKWNSFRSAKLEPFTEFVVGSLNNNIPLSTVFRAASNGVSVEYQADFDVRSYGNFSCTYILGNPFGSNAIVSPLLPDGITIGLPVGAIGNAGAGVIRPIINNFLTQMAGGAGSTGDVFQAGIDGVRNTVITPIVNAVTNILLDTSPGSSTDTLQETRPGLNGPGTQNNMGSDQAGGDGT